mgnify:CR=1 FL=1
MCTPLHDHGLVPGRTKIQGTAGTSEETMRYGWNYAMLLAKGPSRDALVRDLAAGSDVLIENYKVGTLARYGLDYGQLSALNPRLVYCSITGFGQTGPYRDRAGYDYAIQGLGGLMSVTGERDDLPGGGPQKAGVAAALVGAPAAHARDAFITVASTTSTEQSGLFKHILPLFTRQAGIEVYGNWNGQDIYNSYNNIILNNGNDIMAEQGCIFKSHNDSFVTTNLQNWGGQSSPEIWVMGSMDIQVLWLDGSGPVADALCEPPFADFVEKCRDRWKQPLLDHCQWFGRTAADRPHFKSTTVSD